MIEYKKQTWIKRRLINLAYELNDINNNVNCLYLYRNQSLTILKYIENLELQEGFRPKTIFNITVGEPYFDFRFIDHHVVVNKNILNSNHSKELKTLIIDNLDLIVLV